METFYVVCDNIFLAAAFCAAIPIALVYFLSPFIVLFRLTYEVVCGSNSSLPVPVFFFSRDSSIFVHNLYVVRSAYSDF